MAKLFKKFKLAKKQLAKQEKEKPKVKTLRVDKTHKGIRDEVDTIFILLDTPNRHSTAFRKIINLEKSILNQNIYLIAKRLLMLFLVEDGFDKPEFKKIFAKFKECDNFIAIQNLLYKYLKILVLGGYRYVQLLNFMIRNCSSVLKENKEELSGILVKQEDKDQIERLKTTGKNILFTDRVCFYNDRLEVI